MESVRTETFRIKGMFCTNCEKRVREALLKIPGVSKAEASFEKETAVVTYEADKVSVPQMQEVIGDLGYEMLWDASADDAADGNAADNGKAADDDRTIRVVSLLIILLAVYVIADHLGWTRIFNIFPGIETTIGFGMLFVIGLLTSVHCIAMCGGINLTQSTVTARSGGNIGLANLAYNAGRVVSYTVIGGIVGGIGSVFSLQGKWRGAITVAVGVIMIIMALAMLGIFRPLRRLPLHLPAGFYGKTAKLLKGRSSFVIGLLNGFMPCGPLQSMQIYALSTGSMARGAVSMFIFSAGTVPLMLGFGLLSGKLNKKYARSMLTVSAVLIFIMGIRMAGNGLALSGVSLPSGEPKQAGIMAENLDGRQRVTTQVDFGSYEAFTVRKGIPVDWTIIVPEGKLNGCNGEIIVPAYDLTVKLHEGENEVTFMPQQTGTIPYSCWMGMIKSNIEVVE